MKRTVLVLYSELAGYTISCFEAVLAAYPGTALHVVRWPVNAEAPFAFKGKDGITFYDRHSMSEEQLTALAEKITPDLIVCSGWMDKGYKSVCSRWKGKIPVVLTMDNKWQGTLKQRIAAMLSVFLVRKYYSHCWVPGEQQKQFAKKLGFSEASVRTGFYSCDLQAYNAVYQSFRATKAASFPRVFFYAGRFYAFKGVNELWSAYNEFSKVHSGWKLICIGNGDQQPPSLPDAAFYAFMQPDALRKEMQHAGIFIMPSKKEPWGVAAHEFAAAGFPLLLSSEVGAGEAFLRNGENGFSFAPGSSDELISAMKKIAQLSDAQLLSMGDRSHELAQNITPQRWAKTLMGFIDPS
jgi:glycosyltransferase involved in cell wall biosynthesis